jgi:hypothetical protein
VEHPQLQHNHAQADRELDLFLNPQGLLELLEQI